MQSGGREVRHRDPRGWDEELDLGAPGNHALRPIRDHPVDDLEVATAGGVVDDPIHELAVDDIVDDLALVLARHPNVEAVPGGGRVR